MLERSDSGKYSKAIFYRAFNDIEVFVEDTAVESRKVYVEIMRRLVGDTVSIANIFPVGPKAVVIKRCAEDQGGRPRPAVYIVDGDYDIIRGRSIDELKRLYRIGRYCIENYLVDTDAIIDIVNEEILDKDIVQIRASMDFAGWEEKVSQCLSELTIFMCVAGIKQCDGLPSVKLDLSKIRGDFDDHVDVVKVASLKAEYKKRIDDKYGEGAFDEAFNAVGAVSDCIDYKRHCSGKSVIMPLVTSRIRRKLSLNLDYRMFKVKLATRCNIDELRDISSVIC